MKSSEREFKEEFKNLSEGWEVWVGWQQGEKGIQWWTGFFQMEKTLIEVPDLGRKKDVCMFSTHMENTHFYLLLRDIQKSNYCAGIMWTWSFLK